MKSLLKLAAVGVLMAASALSFGKDIEKAREAVKPAEKPQIEVVFVLDTTGSMSGLINAAKEKIWSIANTLATSKPAPMIKMGVIGYRDKGDQYVTKLVPLTSDLDAVYKELMAFAADGGGDGPESVNQALDEAVNKLEWSKDAKTYRVLFLVGDYPPHMDYQDDVKYQSTCEAAAKKGIIINTIQCGNNSETEKFWRDIAVLAEGQFFRVEQGGGAILAGTPFDAELARLGVEMDKTRMYFGNKAQLASGIAKEKAAEAAKNASSAAQAQRAEFLAKEASKGNYAEMNELVDKVQEGKVRLADIKKDELPEELKKMSPAELEKHVKAAAARRAEIQKKITELSEKRQAHIKEQIEKNADKNKSSLDVQLFDTIKGQASKKGIEYQGGPSY